MLISMKLQAEAHLIEAGTEEEETEIEAKEVEIEILVQPDHIIDTMST